eukprot:jgi/Mesvir1/5115/Mv15273-RA.1
MADEPSRKKRAPEAQLTKDDIEREDSEDEEEEHEAGATFRQASADVLAKRRIVKARRPTADAGGGSSGAAKNPFAGIKFAPAPAAAPEKPAAEGSATPGEKAEAAAAPAAADGEKDKDDASKSESALSDEGEKKDDGSAKAFSPRAFSTHSAVPNAFSNAFAATANGGASTSTTPFSLFGAATSPSSAFPSLSSVFGSSNGAPVALFGGQSTTPFRSDAGGASAPAVKMSGEPLLTGEEGEEAVYMVEASLFEFVEGGAWKERGRGELKLNVKRGQSEGEEEKPVTGARLVMRAKGNLRLLLNAPLFADMTVTRMENRGISFAAVNCAAGDGTDTGASSGAPSMGTFALRVRDAVGAGELFDAVTTWKKALAKGGAAGGAPDSSTGAEKGDAATGAETKEKEGGPKEAAAAEGGVKEGKEGDETGGVAGEAV